MDVKIIEEIESDELKWEEIMIKTKKIIIVLLAVFIFILPSMAQEIHKAVREGDIEKVKTLLEENPELVNTKGDLQGEMPIHWAATQGKLDIVKLLIEKGADLNVFNIYGDSPLHGASQRGFASIVDLLIKKGADLDAESLSSQHSAINYAAMGGHIDVVNLLLEKGANIEIKTQGSTALHLAARGGHRNIVELLINNGLDVNLQIDDGPAPLHSAVANGQEEIVNLLISKGANVNVEKKHGLTSLHFAAAYGYKTITEVLIANGADFNARCINGKTPLHYALEHGYSEIIELLKSKGAKDSQAKLPVLRGEYFNLKRPGLTPEIFAPGILSNINKHHIGLTFSPDGKEVFWSRSKTRGFGSNIWFMKLENGIWTNPQIASFSGMFFDDSPAFSHDNKRLFFSSNRPLEKNGKPKDMDIWFVERKGTAWGGPENPGTQINSEKTELNPTISMNGTLYFQGIGYKDSFGGADLYRSRFENGSYLEPENLGESINSNGLELHPCIAPDESYLLFASSRPGGFSTGLELYISFRQKDGSWTQLKNLGELNNIGHPNTPEISPNGKYLFFSNWINGSDDFYWVDAKIIEALKPRNLK